MWESAGHQCARCMNLRRCRGHSLIWINHCTYTVTAKIPGVAKDNIHVTIDGNQIIMSGEVCEKKE